MLMYGVKTENLASGELAEVIKRMQNMTNGRDDLEFTRNNKKVLMQMLNRIMRLSKQEKEWYIYFLSLFESIRMSWQSGDKKKTVQFAEIYYRDSALYMDRELPNYSDTNMMDLNSFIYSYIYSTYIACHEIDDHKMNQFMEMYEAAALKYGRTFMYYEYEMEMGILYHDMEIVEHGRHYFEKYEYDMNTCYVCEHNQYLGYYILRGEIDKAEKLMQDFRQRRIPKKYQWCYKVCESAREDYAIFYIILRGCLVIGNPEAFRLFYGKYWLTLPKRMRRKNTLFMFCCAITGDFGELEEKDIPMAEEDVREGGRMSTLCKVIDSLNWMCYFRLLDDSGIKEIRIDLSGLLIKENGKADSLAVSAYFEQRADEEAAKFGLARAKFDYAVMKNTCLECAGLL